MRNRTGMDTFDRGRGVEGIGVHLRTNIRRGSASRVEFGGSKYVCVKERERERARESVRKRDPGSKNKNTVSHHLFDCCCGF